MSDLDPRDALAHEVGRRWRNMMRWDACTDPWNSCAHPGYVDWVRWSRALMKLVEISPVEFRDGFWDDDLDFWPHFTGAPATSVERICGNHGCTERATVEHIVEQRGHMWLCASCAEQLSAYGQIQA